jgi:hypothetical protein
VTVYRIAGEEFSTKTQIVERAKRILRTGELDAPLEGEDLRFMKVLLAMHPDAKEKMSGGVQGIYIRKNFGGSNGFEIKRDDGSFIDFSHYKCLKLRRKNSPLNKALRLAIVPQVQRAKKKFFNGYTVDSGKTMKIGDMEVTSIELIRPEHKCPFTGEPLSWSKCHVDHAPPYTFERLVKEFLESEKLSPDAVETVGYYSAKVPIRLVDLELEKRWIAFHEKRAVLRVVSIKANLSIIPKLAKEKGNGVQHDGAVPERRAAQPDGGQGVPEEALPRDSGYGGA